MKSAATLSMSEWIDNILKEDEDIHSREMRAQKSFAKPQKEADSSLPAPPRGGKQQSTQKQQPPAQKQQAPQQPEEQPIEEPQQPAPEQQSQDQNSPEVASPDVDDVVDKLNQIRAGKSFKDDNINAALRVYFNGLEPDQKETLLQHLRGISQIVSGVGDTPNDQNQASAAPPPAPQNQQGNEAPPAQQAQPAPTPPVESPPPESQKKDTRKVKKIDPAIIHKGRSRGIEDYSPPTPISIKKR